MGQSGQNFAFIDANNLHLSVIGMGWKLDYRKFRRYLSDKYHVSVAYYFIGEIPGMESLYSYLSNIGYSLVFKPPIIDKTGRYKGNVDAELVLQAVIDQTNYDKAVIITSDGDFSCLISYLNSTNKLERLLASSRGGCSKYLRKAAGSKVDYMDDLRAKLEYIK